MKAIWVVDDDRSIRWVLEKALQRENLPFRMFEDAADVIAALQAETPSVLLSDIRMKGTSGMELLHTVKKEHPEVPVIIMTAFSDLDSAVNAFQGGAYEYLAKPFDINRAIELLRRACEESGASETPQTETGEAVPEIIGQSAAMQEVFRAIGRLSQSNVTVLVTGESGTGKEVVARALHNHSPRRSAPFVAINTAAIPRELLESELFGHEKGAFTGANSLQYGRFEQAKGGTLFYRVGGCQLIRSDVRVIAATNQNLEARVREGLFREDLFHRLNVIRLRLPPLRERSEDIAALADHFLAEAAKNLKTERKHLKPEALDFIRRFPFPGNVRQLENLCNWLTVMAPSQWIRTEDLPDEFLRGEAAKDAVKGGAEGEWTSALKDEIRAALTSGAPEVMAKFTRDFECAVFRAALDFTHGRKVEAAQKLGVGRNTLTRKIQELGL